MYCLDKKKGVVVAPPIPLLQENLITTGEITPLKWDHGNKVFIEYSAGKNYTSASKFFFFIENFNESG